MHLSELKSQHVSQLLEMAAALQIEFAGDVADGTGLRHIIEKVRPDEVYNLAAQSHVQVSFETAESANALHDATFDVLLVLIGLHVAAILFYRVALGKRLTRPMITGRAALDPQAEPMRPGKWWAALLCLAFALAVTRWIIAGAPPL